MLFALLFLILSWILVPIIVMCPPLIIIVIIAAFAIAEMGFSDDAGG